MSEEEIRQLLQELKSVKTEYTRAKTILSKIEDLQTQYETLSGTLDSIKGETDEHKTEIAKYSARINSILEEIRSTQADIAGYLESANTNIQELRSLSERASELKGTIEGRSGEIDALLKSARAYSSDIEKLKSAAQTNLDLSTNLMADFQSKVSEMQTAHADFLQIQNKIEDKDTGLKAALAFVKNTQTKSDSILKEINLLKDTATNTTLAIENLKKRSEINNQQIEETLEYAIDKKKQVEEVSGLVIDGSFAQTFQKRKEEINKSLNLDRYSWKRILILSVTFLAITVLLPFMNISGFLFNFGSLSGFDGFLIRFFYTFPLIFLVAFSATQYSKERQFLERYAFKAASAASVRNHIEFLIEKFKDQGDQKDIREFTKEVFVGIYSDPVTQDLSSSENKKDRLFSFGRKKSEHASKMQTMPEMLKELRELIADETIFRQVVDLILDRKK